MPAKSRRQRAKDSGRKKRNADRPARPAATTRQPIAMSEEAPVPVAAPRKIIPAPEIKPAVIPHPYITSELWTIGILAVIMLAILIVLALVMA